ncbi:hypothetical protein VNO80_22603 [Phaseolus coccineus]|uniref:UBC core domain-containing protein n=1 Tax=Phaseolus coccineus TaxID=3886 RepID=A0AAN9M892_PHACN
MENTMEFEHFDVVSDDSDHHFLGSKNGKWLNDSKSKVYKTIVKEWKILEQNLPESIYVRVYERRIDLMRAVIVGAAGTPYHDGLFFFDIVFPSDYPRNPPKRPPRNFEALVGDHFRRRAFSILAACGEYASGRVGVGYYGCDLRFPMVQVSRSSIERMVVLYPRLLEAFRRMVLRWRVWENSWRWRAKNPKKKAVESSKR